MRSEHSAGNRQQAAGHFALACAAGVALAMTAARVCGADGVCRLVELGYGDGDEVRVVGVWQHESPFPRYEVRPCSESPFPRFDVHNI